MIIRLDLSKHCIETAIKKVHDKLIHQYFQTGDDRAVLELAIESIKTILEVADFSELRQKYPELAGSDSNVSLTILKEHIIFIQLEGCRIQIPIT